MKKSNNYIKLIALILISSVSFLTGCSAIKNVSSNYDVGLKVETKVLRFEQGDTQESLTLNVYNKTLNELTSDKNVFLSYHVLDENRNVIEADGLRSKLVAIPARGRGEQTLNFKVPKEAGKYILQIDLVEEGVTWFSDKGNPTAEVEVNVGE